MKRTAGNALIEKCRLALFAALFALALNGEHAFANFHVQILLAEARHRKRDAVMGVVGALDVVGGIGLGRVVLRHGIQKVEQPVKADGRTEQWGEIETSHGSQPPFRSVVVWARPSWAEPLTPPGSPQAIP